MPGTENGDWVEKANSFRHESNGNRDNSARRLGSRDASAVKSGALGADSKQRTASSSSLQ